MLTISAQALDALQQQARPGYVGRLHAQLSESYPHFLPCFPQSSGLQIVANMLGRASRWGLSRQNALTTWCGWMIAVAPNFDEDAQIRATIDALPTPRDQAIPSLTHRISRAMWNRAGLARSNMALFVPLALDNGSASDRLRAALRLALIDTRPDADFADLAQLATADAKALKIANVADAGLVAGACRALWGNGWLQLRWAAELPRTVGSDREYVAALRLRLAIEFGRYI